MTASSTRKCKALTNLLGSLNPRPVWDVQESEAVFHEGSNVSVGIGRIKWQDIGRSDTYPYFESTKKNSKLCSVLAEQTDRHLYCSVKWKS